ncbi:MAG: tetrahydromethanopterin S-methyltransferase subunit E [ANME-2 cluster archaeon]|nr:tetrahydromethanopterin S-methyltransferase subunit E [ANME-2 cluster archaeon]MBC2702544.1 tetrahydromethanopterin S-methyltransferase subunit E [ANME-2 cluster archaeon]MBC2708891.1 tetrahydromethanopterin S-methyltransferase subunit E [ANME-2 cluster archaeon]MBC2746791.1 tetrahydromethanopterin S-methyltransferase subunit E [ANME-2 cluster archaeon]MBC2761734.1 tetrahydromethanopterin S-methyltransferase subunit E [ANME-2 cluster archaeon]
MLQILLLGSALAGLLAFLAGIFENEDSDAGSASNPNSQVQLAPQIEHLHRYYNKAIAGEPPQNALWAALAATVAYILYTRIGLDPVPGVILGAVVGALIAAMLQGMYGSLAHISRIASMKNFKQMLYWDCLLSPLPLSMAYTFLTALCLTLLSFVIHGLLGSPFPVPLIAMFLGFTLGAIASSTGDVHYGAERLYQHYKFGSGIAISKQGDIDIKGEYGYRNSVDTPYFTLRFGGPVTGLTFGLLIFIDALSRISGSVWTSVILEFLIIALILIVIIFLEKYTRDRYGPFEEGK